MTLIAARRLSRLRSAAGARASAGHRMPGASIRTADGLRQLGLGLLVWAGYLLITHSTKVDLASAAARGRTLLDWERRLHLDVELAANRWLADSRYSAGWRPGSTPPPTSSPPSRCSAGCGGAGRASTGGRATSCCTAHWSR